MIHLPRWKIITTFLVCLVGCYYALPNFFPAAYVAQSSWMPQKRLNLGLDLQGGSHILLEVDMTTALRDKYAAMADTLRTTLRQQHIGYVGLKATPTEVTFRLRDTSPETVAKVRDSATAMDRGALDVTTSLPGEEPGFFRIAYTPEALATIKKLILDQSIEIVRRRVDETGTKEPSIQQQGDDRILLQLPGVEKPAHVKDLLGTTAKLAFKMVDHSVSAEDIALGRVPPGSELLESVESTRHDGQTYRLAVSKTPTVTGDQLLDAQPGFDEYQRPIVTFKFDALGGRKFGEATRDNIGKQFAIVLDNKIVSAPVIQSAIMGGSGIIQGSFTLQETQDLSLLLRAGALPAPLSVLEERSVGPDLGADSILAGERATVYAIILVGLFMILAYAFFGLIADIAVIFNIIFLLAGLTVLQATLTLPGIAGIALTIGMAVDANVLIYERIKEELRKGRAYPAAIDAGYQRAMSTILDSNITTLLGALFLYQFGTGPIRGFAVTLALGIVISMFTAITLTRVVTVVWLRWRKPKVLSI